MQAAYQELGGILVLEFRTAPGAVCTAIQAKDDCHQVVSSVGTLGKAVVKTAGRQQLGPSLIANAVSSESPSSMRGKCTVCVLWGGRESGGSDAALSQTTQTPALRKLTFSPEGRMNK